MNQATTILTCSDRAASSPSQLTTPAPSFSPVCFSEIQALASSRLGIRRQAIRFNSSASILRAAALMRARYADERGVSLRRAGRERSLSAANRRFPSKTMFCRRLFPLRTIINSDGFNPFLAICSARLTVFLAYLSLQNEWSASSWSERPLKRGFSRSKTKLSIASKTTFDSASLLSSTLTFPNGVNDWAVRASTNEGSCRAI